jgi:hypothetical protein
MWRSWAIVDINARIRQVLYEYRRENTPNMNGVLSYINLSSEPCGQHQVQSKHWTSLCAPITLPLQITARAPDFTTHMRDSSPVLPAVTGPQSPSAELPSYGRGSVSKG